MTIHDLLNTYSVGSTLECFYNELCAFSPVRGSCVFHRAYGTIYGYLWALRENDVITALDFSSILESIKKELGRE